MKKTYTRVNIIEDKPLQEKELKDFEKVIVLKHGIKNIEKQLSKAREEIGVITSERDEARDEAVLLKNKIKELERHIQNAGQLDKTDLMEAQKEAQKDKFVQSLEERHREHLRIIKLNREDNRTLIAKICGLENIDSILLSSILNEVDHKKLQEVFVIGGAEIYKQFMELPETDTMYITEIHAEIKGNVYFPLYDKNEWKEISRVHHSADEKHEYAFDFVTYDRK